MDLVHQMLTRFYESATYLPLYLQADLQAYREDKFEGWVRQPSETGPVLFSNSSPSYVRLKPASATTGAGGEGGGDDGGGGSSGLIIGVLAVALLGALGAVVVMRRRGTADERE
jgi:peptide/nickel transport system substrate-binding protein